MESYGSPFTYLNLFTMKTYALINGMLVPISEVKNIDRT